MSDTDSVASGDAVVQQQLTALSQLSGSHGKRPNKKAREMHEENKLFTKAGGLHSAVPEGALKHVYRRGKFLPEEDKQLKDLFAQAALEFGINSEDARDVSLLA